MYLTIAFFYHRVYNSKVLHTVALSAYGMDDLDFLDNKTNHLMKKSKQVSK